MIQSVFILDGSREVLIEKHYRGNVRRVECDKFRDLLQMSGAGSAVPPVIRLAGSCFAVHVNRGALVFLALVAQESSPALALQMLERIAELLQIYFGECNEFAIKEHFVTVYELLDEIMDNGYAMTTESNVLMELLPPPSMLSKLLTTVGPEMASAVVSEGFLKRELPRGSLTPVPWRRLGAKYSQNEVFIDINESVDAIVGPDGRALYMCVAADVVCDAHLSGMPDLKLVFTDPLMISDCSLHPCVRYASYERDKVLSFVPPDGKCTLMRYIVRNPQVSLPIEIQSDIRFNADRHEGSVRITFVPRFSAAGSSGTEQCGVRIPFPFQVQTAVLSADVGTVRFDPSTRLCDWRIGTLARGRLAQLSGVLHLDPNQPCPERKPSVMADFYIPLASLTGMGVQRLDVYGEAYKPFKGLKCSTSSGQFEFR
ncbi:AP-3 complex subunit mu-1 [Porphyridium purpureum]|uniref:AP-3 complex subunit mu-1 n=1 Tax=Porphyridium purpureum TaxID=35688 RepID=A0A5J4YSX9_PORPP|nr:AP-3 complex subunit mu-1 [Porphyridium purpureum]|eukprot:POR6889..scf236_6